MKYSYGYIVKDDATKVDFGHRESRNGTVTKGRYNVVLPDGRRQIVKYHVNGDSGYVADVTYEGETTETSLPENDKLSISV